MTSAFTDPPRTTRAATVTAEGETFPSAPKRLKYVSVATPAPGTAVLVAPGVHWARIPLPFELNHINVWLIEDGEGCVVVDTGLAADIGKEAWEMIGRELFARLPLRAVFVTHIHPDHLGLAAWLQERFDVPVLMSKRTNVTARRIVVRPSNAQVEQGEAFLRAHGMAQAGQIQSMLTPERLTRMVSGVPHRVREIADGETLRWGGTDWVALETNGHAEGHLCLSNAPAKVLISGDQVLPTISSNISYSLHNDNPNPLNSFLESLGRLRELPADTLVLPSHGLPFYGLQHRVDDLRRHHEEQLEKLTRFCEQPRQAAEVLPLMFRRELKGMHLFLALGEALAHLEYLVHAGRLERHAAAGTIRYASADAA